MGVGAANSEKAAGKTAVLQALFLKFDDVGAVIDPNRPELAEEVLAQQSVEVHVKHLLQLVEVHDGHLLAYPHVLAQAEIGRTPQRVSGEASGALAMRHALELEAGVAVNLRAHDGSVGAGVQDERGGVTIHFSQDDDQGLHGAEGNPDRSGMRRIGHGRQEEQQESQSARGRQGTPGAQRNTRAYLAACVQNGGAAGTSGTECAMVNCVQIKLSRNSVGAMHFRAARQTNLSVCCF
jgi:hypothetical protein